MRWDGRRRSDRKSCIHRIMKGVLRTYDAESMFGIHQSHLIEMIENANSCMTLTFFLPIRCFFFFSNASLVLASQRAFHNKFTGIQHAQRMPMSTMSAPHTGKRQEGRGSLGREVRLKLISDSDYPIAGRSVIIGMKQRG